jgi:hypothetical protein
MLAFRGLGIFALAFPHLNRIGLFVQMDGTNPNLSTARAYLRWMNLNFSFARNELRSAHAAAFAAKLCHWHEYLTSPILLGMKWPQ